MRGAGRDMHASLGAWFRGPRLCCAANTNLWNTALSPSPYPHAAPLTHVSALPHRVLSFRLPELLRQFLCEPQAFYASMPSAGCGSRVLVSFSWESGDEPSMQYTFGLGQRQMKGMVDLQVRSLC